MSRVSIRYAKAIFSLALEEKKLDEVAADLNGIKSLIESNTEFNRFIINPLVSHSQQLKIVKELFNNKVSGLTLNFLELICRKKRLNQLTAIIAGFDALLLDHRNQLFAEVTSADPLNDEQLDAIKSKLETMTQKSVLLKTKTEPDLIGGFKVFIEGVIIDNSIQYQLEKLKEKLIA